MSLLYCLVAAGLFLASLVWLQLHWFWAASSALLGSVWLTFGARMFFTESGFAETAVARWVRKDVPAETIVTHLSSIDAAVSAIALALAVGLSILCFQLIPWKPESVLGYVGYISLCLVAPLMVMGCYLGALEQIFGKRLDRVLAVLRTSDHPTFKAAIDLWNKRQEEAEEAKQQDQEKSERGCVTQDPGAPTVLPHFTCGYCHGRVSVNPNKPTICEKCGRNLKLRFRGKCPKCGGWPELKEGLEAGTGNAIVGWLLFGGLGAAIGKAHAAEITSTYHCRECGHKWGIELFEQSD